MITINGIVTDREGEPLPFASIYESNSKGIQVSGNGTSSNINGIYLLQNLQSNHVTFSHIGYKDKTYKVSDICIVGKCNLNVGLEVDSVGLGEVVINVERDKKLLGLIKITASSFALSTLLFLGIEKLK